MLQVKSVLLTLSLLLLIFFPKIDGIDIIMIINIFIISYFVIKYPQKTYALFRRCWIFFLPLFLLLVWSLISFLINSFIHDTSIYYIGRNMRIILSFFSILCLINFNKNNFNLKQFCFSAHVLLLIICYIQRFSSHFKILILKLYSVSYYIPHRVNGLSYYTPTGILLAIMAVVSLYFYFKEKKVWYLATTIATVPLFFITSRTALLVFVFMATILTIVHFSKGKFDLKKFYLRILCPATFLLLVFRILFDKITSFLESIRMEYKPLNWILSAQSLQFLSNSHYHIPVSLGTFMIGCSMYQFMPWSDIGFLIYWHGLGIIGLSLLLASFIALIYMLHKQVNRTYFPLLCIILIGMFITNFKGNYLFGRQIWEFVCVLIAGGILCSKN